MESRRQISRITHNAYRGVTAVEEYLNAMQEATANVAEMRQYILNSLKTKDTDLEILRDLKPEDAEKENFQTKKANLVTMIKGVVVSFFV